MPHIRLVVSLNDACESAKTLVPGDMYPLAAVAVARGVYTTKPCGSLFYSFVNTGKAMSDPRFISVPLFFFVAVCRRGDRVEANCHSAVLVGAHLRSMQAIVLSLITCFVRHYRRHCFMSFLIL